MTTDENILEEMFERVTNPAKETVDNLSVQMFCMIVQSNNELITKAHDLIVKKMHSSNTTEASRAIALLEECMSKGGPEFKKKTAKFYFLNKLIALVLDKQINEDTPVETPAPVETKKRIMECLMLWTVEYQDESKIQNAYDSLSKQVNFAYGPSTAVNSNSPALTHVREQRSSILGKDDHLVAKLLKQGGEENLKKANLLIQHRFNQDAKRTEFICKLKSELKIIESTMEVLDEMLSSYSPEATGEDSLDIMEQLYNTCKAQNEQMARWPDSLGDEGAVLLVDILNTKELLIVVLQRYKELFESEINLKSVKAKHKATTTTTTTSKANTSAATITNNDLLSELMGDILPTSIPDTNSTTTASSNKINNTMDELSEIFGSIKNNSDTNIDLLEPISISVFDTSAKNASAATSTLITNGRDAKKSTGFKELKEIDKLSEEMFKQNLKHEQRLLSFKKETEKITLNDLAKDKIQTSLTTPKAADNLKTTPIKVRDDNYTNATKFDDLTIAEIKDIKEKETKVEPEDILHFQQELDIVKDTEKMNLTEGSNVTLKPLAEITVNLDDVNPVEEGQRLLSKDDDDIQVTLNLTSDRPSEHVSVIVMTVTNKSKLHVKDFQFEASVKKPCKVRLLPPTDVAMAPSKPFRPSPAINQVVLLLNPTQNPVDITCIIGYKLGDDPDPIKESIVANSIPYV